jgi:hypothetical protein
MSEEKQDWLFAFGMVALSLVSAACLCYMF